MPAFLSDWFSNERAWIVGPFVLWLAAWLLYALFIAITRRQPLHPFLPARRAGLIWKIIFVAALAWLVGWSLVLTVTA